MLANEQLCTETKIFEHTAKILIPERKKIQSWICQLLSTGLFRQGHSISCFSKLNFCSHQILFVRVPANFCYLQLNCIRILAFLGTVGTDIFTFTEEGCARQNQFIGVSQQAVTT
jgi:hypothetical protein